MKIIGLKILGLTIPFPLTCSPFEDRNFTNKLWHFVNQALPRSPFGLSKNLVSSFSEIEKNDHLLFQFSP